MNIEQLSDHVANSPAVKYETKLQPTAGTGTKVYPSSYLGENKEAGVYAHETRMIDGHPIACVIVDSVPSQANRAESALSELRREGRLSFPAIALETDAGSVCTLDLPHRAADAYLEHGKLDGEQFAKSDVFKAIRSATPRNASKLFQVDPVSLLFGVWFSRGNNAAKGRFSRLLCSELVAINAIEGVKTASRVDPLRNDTSGEALEAKEIAASELPYSKDAKKMKVSELGFGSIPPTVTRGGITCDYVQQVATLTFSGLRRLSFGDDPTQNRAGRLVLAALGLVAIEATSSSGLWLRSGCDLYATESSKLIVGGDEFELDLDGALGLFNSAVSKAAESGLCFEDSLTLTADSPVLEAVLGGGA